MDRRLPQAGCFVNSGMRRMGGVRVPKGQGPHGGRARNLGKSVRVTLDSANHRYANRLCEQLRRRSPTLSLSDVIRALVDVGLEHVDSEPWPGSPKDAASTHLVRLDPVVHEALRERSKRDGRPLTWVINGLVEIARRSAGSRSLRLPDGVAA